MVKRKQTSSASVMEASKKSKSESTAQSKQIEEAIKKSIVEDLTNSQDLILKSFQQMKSTIQNLKAENIKTKNSEHVGFQNAIFEIVNQPNQFHNKLQKVYAVFSKMNFL